MAALRAQAHDVDTTPREYGAIDHTHNLEVQANAFIGDRNANTVGNASAKR